MIYHQIIKLDIDIQYAAGNPNDPVDTAGPYIYISLLRKYYIQSISKIKVDFVHFLYSIGSKNCSNVSANRCPSNTSDSES